MKIVLDTKTKETICPPDFFDNITKINDASDLTGTKEKISPEQYLEKIIKECTKVIINKSQTTKRRSKKSPAEPLGTFTKGLTIEPTK